MVEKLKLSLVENAIDFIKSAVHFSKTDNPSHWKYALLHLASAIELIMKAILEKEHWSLLFEDVDTAAIEKLKTGDFKSVSYDTAINRIKRILGKPINKDEKYLQRIRELRNRIMHFSVEININELRSLIARGLNIFIRFYKEIEEEDAAEEFIFFLNAELKHFEKYVALRLAEIRKELKKYEKPSAHFSSCPYCFQDTLIFHNDNRIKCLFCGFKTNVEDLSNYSDGPGGPCPKCDGGFLGFVVYNNDEGEYICVKCGFKSQFSYNVVCSRCGQIYWDEEGDSIMCEDCWEIVLKEKDQEN